MMAMAITIFLIPLFMLQMYNNNSEKQNLLHFFVFLFACFRKVRIFASVSGEKSRTAMHQLIISHLPKVSGKLILE